MITGPLSSFPETKSSRKESSFPDGTAIRQSPATPKIWGFAPQEHRD